MKIRELIDSLVNYQVLGDLKLDKELLGLTNDSRNINRGDAFVAIRGQRFDGHDVLEQVIGRGVYLVVAEEYTSKQIELAEDKGVTLLKVPSTFRAQAILANQYFDQPTCSLNVVAVTGTNGKTTTSHFISQLLELWGRKTGVIGTLHYKIGDRTLSAVNTTPEALTLQRYFKEMVEEGCQDAVIEASSHALALGRLWYTDIDCAIFTNLTREHLDFHQTMDKYANAKSLLFAQLGQQFHQGKARMAILNIDDPYYEIMSQATAADILTYSMVDPQATVYADQVEHVANGLNFKLHFNGQSYSLHLPFLGQYNIMNYLAAFLCLVYYYECPVQELLDLSRHLKGVTGRMQVIDEGQPYTVVADFAHTPDALRNVLKELKSQTKKRLMVLFGHSGGNRDSAARPELGDILFEWADQIILTADNPRYEPVQKIVTELVGPHKEKPYMMIEDREAAINHLINQAQTGDTLLFAGKAGETYQVIGDEYIPYDEIALIKKAIQA